METKKIVEKLARIEDKLNSDIFVEREKEVRGVPLAFIANTNILLLGDPGVAKSLIATSWAQHVEGANYFEWLMTPYTTPDEIAGHFSFAEMQNDKYMRKTQNTLCEAHFALLDEFWNCNGGAINFLLPLMNERIYYNDNSRIKAPLLTLIGASNQLPEEDDHLEAALDRFVLKFNVETIKEKNNWIIMAERFLENARKPRDISLKITLDEIRHLQSKMPEVKVSRDIIIKLNQIQSDLQKENILISPRVFNNCLKILQASALLAGRFEVEHIDFISLRNVMWRNPEDESKVFRAILKRTSPERQLLREQLDNATELYREFVDIGTDDSTESISRVIGIIQSLKKAREKMVKIKGDLTKENPVYMEVEKGITKVNEYIKALAASDPAGNLT